MRVKYLINTMLLLMPLVLGGIAQANDQAIPWGENTGGVESNHIAAVGQNLNASHQKVTKTQEGVWAANTGSISNDEKALTNGQNPTSK
ncbi:Uncharacterised protein [Serratia grimesii]|jgi:hypothetical protein|uniref:hypothetical protein n=1 Tax=Serratia grimesii TaxID=82995 RepID=UPI002179D2BE|nr:hypothetical protein [Serratia grimesii]CAI0903168.1 Uncharacterised protein [Serratia grimesii]CAI1542290.1 Uncharacterised protein [Serratia grimesii]CAI2785085.1 Uncharacterised protein [Serratia grimesii]